MKNPLTHIPPLYSRAPAGLARALLCPAVLALLLSGCEAMQGVNVGASVPIGGVVKVGANKTIGDGNKQTQPANKSAEKSSGNEEDEESAQDQ